MRQLSKWTAPPHAPWRPPIRASTLCSRTSMPDGFRYIDAVRSTLAEEMERDDNVCMIGIDIGHEGGVFKATKGLQARFGPARVMDTPIAEAGVLGAAVGAAMAG